jgi:NitT/TauT family transport system permease protein
MSTVPRSSFVLTVAQRVVLVVLLLAAWWLVSLRMPQFILPGPLRVAHAFVGLVQSGTFFDDLGITLYRVVAGFLLAAAVGAPLGIALGSNPRVAHFFEPLLSIVNTVSSAIWAVFAIIWFGISNATTIFVVFMTAMPLILTNVWQGALTVDHNHVELARSFRMSHTQIMRKIFLPTILPHFFAGARLAFGFGWRVSLVAGNTLYRRERDPCGLPRPASARGGEADRRHAHRVAMGRNASERRSSNLAEERESARRGRAGVCLALVGYQPRDLRAN